MSTLIVPLVAIKEIKPHVNADRLALALIEGWQVVVGKDSGLQPGDLGVYVPPQTQVPEQWSGPEQWDVQKYLEKGVRTKAVKLRGEASHGFFVPLKGDTARVIEEANAQPGDNVAELFGLTKYQPVERIFVGDQRQEDPLFSRYTDIENLRHEPDGLNEGELVWVTEKIHGTNSRIGIVQGEPMAGSHKVQRKRPGEAEGEVVSQINPGSTVYWFPWTIPGVEKLLTELSATYSQVILFGEIFGPRIQKLGYGVEGDQLQYQAFDLMLDGKYVSYRSFFEFCEMYGVPRVPLLYEGPYSFETVKELANGKTTLDATHIREGVVVRPYIERTSPKHGRVIWKYVSDDYLTGNFED